MSQKLPAFVLNEVVAGDESRCRAPLTGEGDTDQLIVEHLHLQVVGHLPWP